MRSAFNRHKCASEERSEARRSVCKRVAALRSMLMGHCLVFRIARA